GWSSATGDLVTGTPDTGPAPGRRGACRRVMRNSCRLSSFGLVAKPGALPHTMTLDERHHRRHPARDLIRLEQKPGVSGVDVGCAVDGRIDRHLSVAGAAAVCGHEGHRGRIRLDRG